MRDLRGRSRRGYVGLPWGQVHYRSAGERQAPAVVMLHQSPLSSATYEPALGLVADRGLYAVALDTPGYGLSDPPPRQWSIPDYADAVWQVADALDVGNVVLLGQHTGAVIAAEAARYAPSRVDGLVLHGLPLYGDDERVEKRASWAPGYRPSHDGDHLLAVWQRIHALYPGLPADAADRQVLEYLSAGPDYGAAYRAVFDHHVDTAAVAGVPTLIVLGDRDLVHRFTPQVTAGLPHAELRVIEGGTDFVADEQPEVFADAVASFVLTHCVRNTSRSGDPILGRNEGDGLEEVVHTATVEVTGGRGGSATSRSGTLVLDLARPADRGREGAGTDPEELFAAGYAACFDSALASAARRERLRIGKTAVTASVSLISTPEKVFGLRVSLQVNAPDCHQDDLDRAVAVADTLCPYSNAVRRNVAVEIRAVGRR